MVQIGKRLLLQHRKLFGNIMRITRRQLRQVIREELLRELVTDETLNVDPQEKQSEESVASSRMLAVAASRLAAEIALGFTPAGVLVDAGYLYDAIVNKPDDKAYLAMAMVGFIPGLGDLAKAARVGGKTSKAGIKLMKATGEIAHTARAISQLRLALGRNIDNLLMRHQEILDGATQIQRQTIAPLDVSSRLQSLRASLNTFKTTQDPVALKSVASTIQDSLNSGIAGGLRRPPEPRFVNVRATYNHNRIVDQINQFNRSQSQLVRELSEFLSHIEGSSLLP